MKLECWQISPRALARMRAAERSLLLGLGHAVNEISVLNKLFYLSNNYDTTQPWTKHAHLTQGLVLARALTGKLLESWNLVQKGYLSSGLKKTYSPLLNAEASEALAHLKRYFGRENLIARIRNSFAFHYNAKALGELDVHSFDPEEMVFYMGDVNGNTLYYASECPVNRAILATIDPADPRVAFERLVDETQEVVTWVNECAQGIMAAIADLYLRNRDGSIETSELEIVNPRMAERVVVPFFLSHRKKKGNAKSSA